MSEVNDHAIGLLLLRGGERSLNMQVVNARPRYIKTCGESHYIVVDTSLVCGICAGMPGDVLTNGLILISVFGAENARPSLTELRSRDST